MLGCPACIVIGQLAQGPGLGRYMVSFYKHTCHCALRVGRVRGFSWPRPHPPLARLWLVPDTCFQVVLYHSHLPSSPSTHSSLPSKRLPGESPKLHPSHSISGILVSQQSEIATMQFSSCLGTSPLIQWGKNAGIAACCVQG